MNGFFQSRDATFQRQKLFATQYGKQHLELSEDENNLDTQIFRSETYKLISDFGQ